MDVGRLIIDPPATGSWNMAVDQALLAGAGQRGRPTLRFYRWQNPTLSLGYFQPSACRSEHAASAGCDMVRRVTGGGAIMHDHELTYSFVVQCDNRWSDENRQLYQLMHSTLVDVLADYHVDAQLYHGSKPEAEAHRFLCFQRRAEGDVVTRDHKIGGSAQRRMERSLLQHGSVLLRQSEFAPELPGIECLSDSKIDIPDLIDRWTDRISAALDIPFQFETLDDGERQLAGQIEQCQFNCDAWNLQR